MCESHYFGVSERVIYGPLCSQHVVSYWSPLTGVRKVCVECIKTHQWTFLIYIYVDNSECPIYFLCKPLQSPLSVRVWCVHHVHLLSQQDIRVQHLLRARHHMMKTPSLSAFYDIKHDSLWSVCGFNVVYFSDTSFGFSSGMLYKYCQVFYHTFPTILMDVNPFAARYSARRRWTNGLNDGLSQRDEPVCHDILDSHG